MSLSATIVVGGILGGLSATSSQRSIQQLTMPPTRGDKSLIKNNEFICASEGYYIIFGHVETTDAGANTNNITLILTFGSNTYRSENLRQLSEPGYGTNLTILLYLTVGQKLSFSWNNNTTVVATPENGMYNIIKSPTTVGAYGPLLQPSNASANQLLRLNMQPTKGTITNNEYTVTENGLYVVGCTGSQVSPNNGALCLIIDVNGIRYRNEQPFTFTIAANASGFYTQTINNYKLLKLNIGDKITFFWHNLTTVMTSLSNGLFGINKIQ